MFSSTLSSRLRAGALSVALLTLTGCAAGHTATDIGRIGGANTMVVALSGAPTSLDFTTTSGSAIPQALMQNVYETLVENDSDGGIHPKLATGWTVSPDQTTYTFQLRQGVTFSNGDPFTADTVKFSIERVLTDAWTNGQKSAMKVVKQVTVLDPYTVQVQLSQPSQRWLWAMGTLVGAQMTPSGVDQLATRPIGTGPYVVTNWAVGQNISFAARPNYWGEKPRSEQVVLRYYSDSVAATNALQSGDADVFYALQSPELVPSLERTGKFRVEVGKSTGEVLLSMNNRRGILQDARVRKAIMYAVNRQDVIDTAWEGFGIDTGGSPAAPSDPWYEPYQGYPFDPQHARELLAEAGVSAANGNNKLTLSVPSRNYATGASDLIVSQLKDVGLDVTIHGVEFPAVWLSEVYKQADYDMSIIVHVEARDIPTLFGNPKYYLGYDSAQVRELLAAADAADPAGQTALYKQAVNQIMADAAADNLFNWPNIVVSRTDVVGLNPDMVTDGLVLSHLERKNAQ